MKYIKGGFVVRNKKWLNSSYYGNPKAEMLLENSDGNLLPFKTATDAACGYAAANYKIGDTINITYRETRRGNLIIDYIND